jgi:hypothetical protein
MKKLLEIFIAIWGLIVFFFTDQIRKYILVCFILMSCQKEIAQPPGRVQTSPRPVQVLFAEQLQNVCNSSNWSMQIKFQDTSHCPLNGETPVIDSIVLSGHRYVLPCIRDRRDIDCKYYGIIHYCVIDTSLNLPTIAPGGGVPYYQLAVYVSYSNGDTYSFIRSNTGYYCCGEIVIYPVGFTHWFY